MQHVVDFSGAGKVERAFSICSWFTTGRRNGMGKSLYS